MVYLGWVHGEVVCVGDLGWKGIVLVWVWLGVVRVAKSGDVGVGGVGARCMIYIQSYTVGVFHEGGLCGGGM